MIYGGLRDILAAAELQDLTRRKDCASLIGLSRTTSKKADQRLVLRLLQISEGLASQETDTTIA